jgi:hypothetical protein
VSNACECLMDCERKLVARAEIAMPLLAAGRLGFESIPYLLIGNFFVDAASRSGMALARCQCRLRAGHGMPCPYD